MKPAIKIILLLTLAASFSRLAISQQDAANPSPAEQQFFAWMDEVNQLNGQLGYYLKEKDGAEAAKAAHQMQQVFVKISAFFASKKTATAATYAKKAVEGFQQTGELAAAGKLPEALQKYYDTRANCEGCHKEHRVRTPDGNWQIKY